MWKCVLPNAKLNRFLKKWTEAERIAEVEAAAGSAKQTKGAKGSSSASAAKPTTTAKSKAAPSSSAAGSGQGSGSQKAKKPPLPPPDHDPEETESSHEEVAEECEKEEPKVDDMVVDPEHDVSKERERSTSALHPSQKTWRKKNCVGAGQ